MVISVTGSEFKLRREKLHLTQSDIALALGVKENTVYRWESDRAPISRTVELALKQLESERHKLTSPAERG